ncbi:hypothetical protein LCGC14_1722770 [marine sediment metagenome]|uniref:Uncharacterized protein n=1 Tax=marine sediment metagenome TaxID=412755 RepID=A0A0F9HBQ9_9ZZZZ
MIGYGLAFVIGWILAGVGRVSMRKGVWPWSPGLILWGLVFMGLNWIASL